MGLFQKLFGERKLPTDPPAEPPITPPPPSDRDYSLLPHFKYHPDPLKTGSIKAEETECLCCGKVAGYIYVGPVFAEDELDEQICPWCIADGYAHRYFGAEFTDLDLIGGGEWDSVPDPTIEEISQRTPGFSGWQQERWWSHCGDAATFIGKAGKKELMALGDEADSFIYSLIGYCEEPEKDDFFCTLNKNGSPTAYLFRCTKCGKLGGYHDCD